MTAGYVLYATVPGAIPGARFLGPFESREEALAFAETCGHEPHGEDLTFRIYPVQAPTSVFS